MAISPEPSADMDLWVPQPWVVREISHETGDTVTLEMEACEGTQVEPMKPGQFMMLYVFGIGEVPISISGSVSARRFLHTIRDVGAVTHALCGLGAGAIVGARGPFGRPWPIEEQVGRDIVIAAGGIGLAPLRPVIEHVVEHREDYDDVVLLYGAREQSQLLYTQSFDGWRARGIQVEVTLDSADQTWSGHVGVVTTLIRYARFQAEQAAAFICGPEIMMRFMAKELLAHGVAPERTYLSMERNMKCAIGLCGHCQLGPEFLCLDGPVFPWPRIERIIAVPQL